MDQGIPGYYQKRKMEFFFFFDLALKHYGRENIFAGNLNVKDTTTYIKATDTFPKEILEVWTEVNFEQQIKVPDAVSRTQPMAQLSN